MDPLSIAAGAVGLADVAVKLFNELRTFIQDYKDVDQNVHDLQSGVKQVQDVCLLIEKYVKLLPESGSEDLDNEDLFIGIETQLSGCAAVIYKVNSKIEKVRGRGSDVISRASRSVRLNMSKDDINECKAQIQAGITNLQLSLQLVNLQATYIAPQLANRTLLEKLEDIQKLLEGQSVDKRLQECADTYLSRGATLYEKSVASSVGGFQHQSRPKAIAEWLEQLDALRLDGSTSPSLPTDDGLYSSNNQSFQTQETTTTTHHDHGSSIPQPAGFDDDDDDEFAMEMAQTALASGRESYQEANYQDAEDRLGESLALIRKLPEHRRRGYDIEEIHLLLALCAFHLHDSSTAEAALVSALDCNTGMNTQTGLHHEAGSALAIIYTRLNKYEPARFTCENVYKGRRKLLGKDNDLCFQSLALLAIIHELQDLPTRANTYKSMIPKDKQPILDDVRSQLTPSEPPEVQIISTQDTETQQKDVVVDEKWMTLERRHAFFLTISSTNHWLAYSMDGVKGLQPTIELRKLYNHSLTYTLTILKDSPATCLDFDSQGHRLFSGHGGAWYSGFFRSWKFPLSVRVWNVDNQQCQFLYNNNGSQDNLIMSTLRYSPRDERVIFTYQFRERATTKSMTDAKLKPGFTVLNSTSGATVYQKDCGPCYIRNFSENFSMVCIQTDTLVKAFGLKDYERAIAWEEIDGFEGDDRNISSLHRSDGSVLSLTTGGYIWLNRRGQPPKVWLKIDPSTGTGLVKIWYAWMGFSTEGYVIVIFTTFGRHSLYIAIPELNLCRVIPESIGDGIIALDASHGAPLWTVSQDSKYLAYGQRRDDTDRIQVLDMVAQVKEMKRNLKAEST